MGFRELEAEGIHIYFPTRGCKKAILAQYEPVRPLAGIIRVATIDNSLSYALTRERIAKIVEYYSPMFDAEIGASKCLSRF